MIPINHFHVEGVEMYIEIRVARWFIFKPKIPIWINFGGP
jgi:hypothetical protein